MPVNGTNIRVTLTPSTGQIQANAPVTLKTNASSVNRLDTLADVVENSPTDGSTLVYRSSDDKYVVEQIKLDGGGF